MKLGIDIGGTFTDLVLLDEATGRMVFGKTLTTYPDPAEGILNGVRQIVIDSGVPLSDVHTIVHGTTLITNPLTVPPIYYVAYQIGARLTGHATPEPFSLADPVSLLDNLQTIGATLFLGLGVSATLAALASYFLISGVWAWRIAAARRSPKHRARATP